MLRAGAKKVYFVQCNDKTIDSIYDVLKQLLPVNVLIVCESGSFANIFKPRFHILVEGDTPDKSKKSYILNKKWADVIVTLEMFTNSYCKNICEHLSREWSLNK